MNIDLNIDLNRLVKEIAAQTANELAPLLHAEQPNQWMNTREAAEYLRCSVHKLHVLSSKREIPCHKLGGQLLFSRQELDEHVRGWQSAAGVI